MARPISKPQFVDLWWDEFCPDKSMSGHCMLCGGPGLIDTRGKVFDSLGRDCGGEAFCICPNGRVNKRNYKLVVKEAE